MNIRNARMEDAQQLLKMQLQLDTEKMAYIQAVSI